MKCEKCGEEDCEKKRADFAKEPWLPYGFELGAQWTSFDNGMTWERFPAPFCNGGQAKGHMTVVGIDQKSGTITVKVDA